MEDDWVVNRTSRMWLFDHKDKRCNYCSDILTAPSENGTFQIISLEYESCPEGLKSMNAYHLREQERKALEVVPALQDSMKSMGEGDLFDESNGKIVKANDPKQHDGPADSPGKKQPAPVPAHETVPSEAVPSRLTAPPAGPLHGDIDWDTMTLPFQIGCSEALFR